MPKSMQWLATIIPSTPYFDIYSRITLMGANFGDVKSRLVSLIVITTFWVTAVFFRMRFLFKSEIKLQKTC
jgi:hypothetical protein